MCKNYNPSKAHQDAAKKPNAIEEAIGDRAKDPKAQEKFTKEYQTEPIPQNPSEIANVPSPSEMLSLEELNRRTEERLQDLPPEEPIPIPAVQAFHPVPKVPIIPVSKPENQPVTKTFSQESPPQKIDESSRKAFEITKNVKKSNEQTLQEVNSGMAIDEIDEYSDAEKKPTLAQMFGKKVAQAITTPAEDIELTALKKYILDDGFVLATVAFHIVSLCAQPMTTPSTTTWDFKDRANIPDMVLALLNQPGYIEGIWPSLKVAMGSNIGNAAWTAGISTTIAFFDVLRTIPTLKELEKIADGS